jgi:spermidine synthase
MPLITLTKTSTEFGEISIVQSRVAGSHIYWQEGWAQSEADRNGVSLAAYVHAIFGLVAQTSAHTTLLIGCGGGTLGTMLIDAGRSVIVVDINPQSINLARQYFSLPDHVACYIEHGESFSPDNLRRCHCRRLHRGEGSALSLHSFASYEN